MIDFQEHVLKPSQDFEAHIAETGGMPEITRAATDLQSAIDRTRQEITAAVFASRFQREVGDNFWAMNPHAASDPIIRTAIDREGLVGLKRTQLEAGLMMVQQDLVRLIVHLVELRADLTISQQEY